MDLVKNTPKGQLTNPYKDTQADIVAEGGQFLLSYSCSGCHGGGGGGGMCPPLTNDTWVYGGSAATLFPPLTPRPDGAPNRGGNGPQPRRSVGPRPPLRPSTQTPSSPFEGHPLIRPRETTP